MKDWEAGCATVEICYSGNDTPGYDRANLMVGYLRNDLEIEILDWDISDSGKVFVTAGFAELPNQEEIDRIREACATAIKWAWSQAVEGEEDVE